MVRPTSKA
jgi:hypothetical protein